MEDFSNLTKMFLEFDVVQRHRRMYILLASNVDLSDAICSPAPVVSFHSTLFPPDKGPIINPGAISPLPLTAYMLQVHELIQAVVSSRYHACLLIRKDH